MKNKALRGGIDTLCSMCNRKRVKEYRKKTKKPHGSSTSQKSTSVYREIIIDFLIKRDGILCGFCKCSLEGEKIQLDHLLPRALGGLNIMDNMRLAHKQCNESQGYKVRKLALGW